ncbi:protein FMC1 homolog [Malaya genurostris]|uniref:protein FMC1 homolog n=1 Tax=Malaya genurostris TaxID=325434 RepID=UPI0026F3D6CB|nr:protein FMC1 homolog [Malaya genurostris]
MTFTTRTAGITLRKLLSEIRVVSTENELKHSLAAKYVLSQFKKFKITEQQQCRAQEEMHYTAKTYLCYLQSIRELKKINLAYNGRGERSIRDTADMVGFKLPHDPK